MSYEKYMKIALQEAAKGCGWVNPNPMVGAVIVKNGEIIGKCYHQKYGELHAERNALAACSNDTVDAEMYVTLEPCCHYGKTPPCTEAIIKSGIKKVIIGSTDANPLVAGKGIDILRSNGIEVITGIMKDECDELNKVFFHYIKTHLPFVVMKYAMTADGKISTATGASRWITAELARKHTHRSRHRYSAIMVGVGTVIADNPMLNCRLENSNNPTRIICDTSLRTPLSSNIVQTAKDIPTIIATACTDDMLLDTYKNLGCKIIKCELSENHINLCNLVQKLGEEKIDSIILEGGSQLNFSALQNGIVNHVEAYIAPKIFGGASAKTAVGGVGVNLPNEAFILSNRKITELGEDILIEWDVCSKG